MPSLSNDKSFGHYFQKNKSNKHSSYVSEPIRQKSAIMNISLECCDISDEDEDNSKMSNKTLQTKHS